MGMERAQLSQNRSSKSDLFTQSGLVSIWIVSKKEWDIDRLNHRKQWIQTIFTFALLAYQNHFTRIGVIIDRKFIIINTIGRKVI